MCLDRAVSTALKKEKGTNTAKTDFLTVPNVLFSSASKVYLEPIDWAGCSAPRWISSGGRFRV